MPEMDRHHLLGLLDKLQSKYSFMDEEYKEFAEALGGKKKKLEFKPGDLVLIQYDVMNIRTEWEDDTIRPVVDIHNDCSRLWKIIENKNEFHVGADDSYGWEISHLCLNKADMHMSEIEKISNFHLNDKIIRLSSHRYLSQKPCMKIRSIEIIS